MDETLELIQKISNERQHLWSLASHGQISPAQRQRIGEITTRLDVLWDQYRREFATENRRSRVQEQRWMPRRAA